MADTTYNLYKDGEKIASSLDVTTYTDTGLNPSTTYSYQISAENEWGESGLSEPVLVTTEDEVGDPPVEPQGLQSTNVTEDSATLEWDEN